jgi:DNA polymerase-3 subunit beta
MTIVATSAELGDNVTEIDADVSGEGIEIAFNVKYLIDVLSVLGTEKMALETTTPTSPGVIKPIGEEEFVHVVMPMHLGPR